MMSFGHHLVSRGLVDISDVLEAMDVQRSKMLPIGMLARREGMLTEKNVFEILNRQPEIRKVFGAIAIELGFLTKKQVGKLLVLQSSERHVGEILADMGVLTRSVMEHELASYEPRKPSEW